MLHVTRGVAELPHTTDVWWGIPLADAQGITQLVTTDTPDFNMGFSIITNIIKKFY